MKKFAVCVFDNTCNQIGREYGIYGRGDYSWIKESLNGGFNAQYNLSEAEAMEIKADFDQVIKDENLSWASVDIDFIEL